MKYIVIPKTETGLLIQSKLKEFKKQKSATEYAEQFIHSITIVKYGVNDSFSFAIER